MYAQQSDDTEFINNSTQSFERDGYSIPANYRGNAFTLDEPPCEDECRDQPTCSECSYKEAAPPEYIPEARHQKDCDKVPQKHGGGLLSGIFDRFSRGFELDDILLIGLIILLLQNDCDRRDETVILLALLLLGGF